MSKSPNRKQVLSSTGRPLALPPSAAPRPTDPPPVLELEFKGAFAPTRAFLHVGQDV